jgi:sRNA-binding protein
MYLHQQDRDTVIKYLADRFPSCFFENPELRRPLKLDIIDDASAPKHSAGTTA